MEDWTQSDPTGWLCVFDQMTWLTQDAEPHARQSQFERRQSLNATGPNHGLVQPVSL